MANRVADHPGKIIKTKWLDKVGLSIPELAGKMKIPKGSLYRTINGVHDVTPEMAVRLSKVLGEDPKVFAYLQIQYDLRKAEAKLKKLKIKSIKPRFG